MDLKDKLIIITGASSGIGRATAIRASQLGASIAALGRNLARLEETLSLLDGSDHLKFSFDITDYQVQDTTIKQIVQTHGSIDGFVHCAGIEKNVIVRLMKPDIYRELFEINVISGLEMSRLIAKKNYISPSGGSFVFLSSVMGKMGAIGKVGYSATKGALIPAIKSLALELAKKRIRCNSVLPGIVETELVDKLFNTLTHNAIDEIKNSHPLGLGKPADVSSLICFLLSDEARWITGSDIVIDGGYSAK